MKTDPAAEPTARRSNILAVDDHPENLLALESVLKDLGQNVVTAGSGKEALLRVLDMDFAVILLDVQMPGMDGFETAAMIRQREKSHLTPIIFVTASLSDRDSHMFKGYQHGAVDYLFKPFAPEILRSKVAVFVELDQKRHELMLRNEELRRSNEALEQFAYVASHDLREPLRKMAGFSQLLERRYKGKLDEEADRLISYIVDGAARLQNLIADLLDFSRVGSSRAQWSVVQTATILERVMENLGVLIQESRAVITHDDLPPVRGDSSQLVQLFQNLVANALKFRGTEPPVVHVGVRPGDDFWEFSVRDNGIGISPQYFPQIFELFKRLHSKEQYPGTGIGLAICKKVVENHGGKIWVESRPGAGSTFFFTLPMSRGR